MFTYNPFEPGCLWLFPHTEWERCAIRSMRCRASKRVHRDLQLKLVGAARVVEPDGNGARAGSGEPAQRGRHREESGAARHGRKFELWSEQAHSNKIRQTIGEEDMSSEMLDLKL